MAITKVLIVDDEPFFCESLRLLFNANNYEVVTANCGQDALTLLTQDTFDLAILDVHLPDKSGTEIMDDVKARSPDCIVIFITGDANIDSALAALKCGAYDYLRKPFEFEELQKTVENALHQKALQYEKKQINEQLFLSEKKYRYLVQFSQDIIYTLDAEGNFTFISEAVENLLGFSAEGLIGKHYSTIVCEEDRDKAQWFFIERRARHRATVGVEIRLAMAQDVSEKGYYQPYLTAELKSMGIYEASSHDGERWHVGTHGVIRDISDRKLDEARIQAANRFLIIGNRHTQMQPLLNDFVAETKVVGGCTAVAIRILDADGRIPYLAYDGFDSDFCNLKEPLSAHSNKGMCARVINNHREPHASFFTTYGSYYINSTSKFLASSSEDQRGVMRNTCHRYGYETIALIPIRSRDRTLGLIHIADREANRLSKNAVEMLEAAALQLGTAIERVQAEQALKDSHDELEKRVDERTEMLLRTKDKLVLEVEQRKKYEHELLGFQQRLRELSSRLIQTEERERRRLALEIHDRIGQTLAVTKMQLGAIQAEFDFEDLKKKIEEIRDLISLTIRDVRTLTFELSPPILYELGLQAALEWLAESIHKQSGLVVEVAVDGSNRNLDADRRVLLFRTCNELLLNVVKHAAAKHARVYISTYSEMITIKISDDGVGFEQTVLENGFDPVERGFGLFSIREQLQHYGGTFKIASVPHRGSAVTIALPLPNTTETEKRNSS